MLGVCEALNLAERLGVAPDVMSKVINVSSGRCWSSEVYNPAPGIVEGVPSGKEYKPGFAVSLMAKDARLAIQSARDSASTVTMGDCALSVYEALEQNGMGGKDFSVAYDVLKKQ